jgi:hypothetical protein
LLLLLLLLLLQCPRRGDRLLLNAADIVANCSLLLQLLAAAAHAC